MEKSAEQQVQAAAAAVRLANTHGARDLTTAIRAGFQPPAISSLSRREPQPSTGAARFLVASPRQQRVAPLKRAIAKPEARGCLELTPHTPVMVVWSQGLAWLRGLSLSRPTGNRPTPTAPGTPLWCLLGNALANLLQWLDGTGRLRDAVLVGGRIFQGATCEGQCPQSRARHPQATAATGRQLSRVQRNRLATQS